MSFVDLLFPREELEALGNKWPEPASKRRKLDLGGRETVTKPSAPPKRQNSESALHPRRHRWSASSCHSGEPSSSKDTNVSTTKRSYSESQLSTTSQTDTTSSITDSASSRSCLPDFIEPSILKNYLLHLHPNDRSRYSLSTSPKSKNRPLEPRRQMSIHEDMEDSASSPGSLTADACSPHSSSDNYPTTPAAICEQLRSGPFNYILDGMRVTDHERDMMEDLLNPNPDLTLLQDEAPGKKPQDADPEANLTPGGYYDIDEGLLQKMFPTMGGRTNGDFGFQSSGFTNADRDCDVHSSGLSPAADQEDEEESDPTPKGYVVYNHSTLSVDDFFDLDEASSAAVPTAE